MTTRIAAASILAITLPLAQGAVAPAGARSAALTAGRSQTDLVARDLTRAETRVSVLPEGLRTQARDAIASARAATSSALDAILALDGAEPHALWSAQARLLDARTALDAASAELRYVTAQVTGVNAQVMIAMQVLQQDIDVLRGTDDEL